MGTENQSLPPQDEGIGSSEPGDYEQHEVRRAAPQDSPRTRRAGFTGGGWIGGAVLIIIGLVFLLNNTTNFNLENWWALFILIPAFGAFASAWNNYQASGRLTSAIRGPFIGGLVLLFVSLTFLFGLDFGLLWPIFLILGGIALLVNVTISGR